MRPIALAIVASFIALLAKPDLALAEKRVALVIGNGAYTKVPKLDNPKNDAAAMETMFRAAGFDTVVRANDLGVAAMRRALRDFSDTAYDADIAVVFYAGHGMEVAGTNYLIPTDAVFERDIDARDEAVSLDRVSEMLEPVKRLRLVILDACRDNPFVRSMRRTLATRTVRSGYGEIDEKSLPPNTLVAYAQRAGATAEDGAGGNSPYTTALLKHLPTPGLDIELALRRVRDEVLKTTRNRQEPFKYGSLGGTEIALVVGQPQPQPTPEPKVTGRLSEAAEAWDRTKDSSNIAVLEEFLVRFNDTYYAALARLQIEELKKQQVAVTAPPAPQVDSSRALRQFDGAWEVYRVSKNCSSTSTRFTIRVAKGMLSSSYGTGKTVTGSVKELGDILFTHTGRDRFGKLDGVEWTYTGVLRGNSGTGTFFKTDNCNGSFTATRN